jgi:hypothetical protein
MSISTLRWAYAAFEITTTVEPVTQVCETVEWNEDRTATWLDTIIINPKSSHSFFINPINELVNIRQTHCQRVWRLIPLGLF